MLLQVERITERNISFLLRSIEGRSIPWIMVPRFYEILFIHRLPETSERFFKAKRKKQTIGLQ